MSAGTWYETIRAEGGELVEKVKHAVREGNVRRIVVKQGERSLAEFPLTVGVVGAVFAPMLAAIGALVALATDCSIEIEREVPLESAATAGAGAGAAPHSGQPA